MQVIKHFNDDTGWLEVMLVYHDLDNFEFRYFHEGRELTPVPGKYGLVFETEGFQTQIPDPDSRYAYYRRMG